MRGACLGLVLLAACRAEVRYVEVPVPVPVAAPEPEAVARPRAIERKHACDGDPGSSLSVTARVATVLRDAEKARSRAAQRYGAKHPAMIAAATREEGLRDWLLEQEAIEKLPPEGWHASRLAVKRRRASAHAPRKLRDLSFLVGCLAVEREMLATRLGPGHPEMVDTTEALRDASAAFDRARAALDGATASPPTP